MRGKKIALAVASSLVLTTGAVCAAEAPPGPYVAAALGAHFAEGSAMEITSGGATSRSSVSFEPGYAFLAAVGYRWDLGFRSELELGYRVAGTDGLDGANASGHQKVFGGMVNVLFDVGIGEGFHPYVGGGAGLAQTKWSEVKSAASAVFDDDNSRFQWQAIVGVEFPFREGTGFFVDYRYIGSTDNRFVSDPAGSVVTGEDNMSHNLLIGVRYRFGN